MVSLSQTHYSCNMKVFKLTESSLVQCSREIVVSERFGKFRPSLLLEAISGNV